MGDLSSDIRDLLPLERPRPRETEFLIWQLGFLKQFLIAIKGNGLYGFGGKRFKTVRLDSVRMIPETISDKGIFWLRREKFDFRTCEI